MTLGWLRRVIPHRFVALRGSDRCGWCAVRWEHHRRTLRCAVGLHVDGTDVMGGYSPDCLRCGRPI